MSATSSFVNSVQDVADVATAGIELLAVVIIVASIVWATAVAALSAARGRRDAGTQREYRTRLGRALLLGLEILVAADVVRTVAVDPSLESAAVLGMLVVIRTFLSWSLSVEIDGRWPWQAGGGDA
ncbi:MAG: DUF1622 domain-containing protein [Solirubrobacteraceae bacterium]